jgi:hypothetical protein
LQIDIEHNKPLLERFFSLLRMRAKPDSSYPLWHEATDTPTIGKKERGGLSDFFTGRRKE